MIRRSSRSLAALVACAAVLLAACSGGGAATAAPTGGVATSKPASASSAAASAPAGGSGGTAATACPTKAPAPMAPGQSRTVTITTPNGNIVIKVEANLGPRAASNFVALASCGYYTNVVFHRLVPGFVIQGGDGEFGRLPNVSTSVGGGGPGYEFADDPVTIPYTRGVVAMANSGPNTNGSQFFIVLASVTLDPLYSVFGHVTSGMDVVDAIAAMPNTGDQNGNAAVNPVAMTKVTVTNP